MSFVHLHCHSEYSLLDGANRIDALIRRAQEFEQPALAITDHGNLHAAWEFQAKARKAAIKPIIGMEAYVAPGDRRAKTRVSSEDKAYYHLVLLARDRVGYQNLVRLSSLGFTEGFYHKPRVDRELLARHAEGLIVASACQAGELARRLLEGDDAAAREVAAWYAEVFRGRYYLEVQAHPAGDQRILNERVFRLAAELSLPVIATNDAHFLKPEDHDAHDVLLCIGLKKGREDADRLHYDRSLYFKSAPEIESFFPDRGDVLTNTLQIADTVDITFDKRYHVPAFPLPKGVHSENELLIDLATRGTEKRFGSPLPQPVRERLDYELDVITKTGYAGYFLVVEDFIRAARERGIPVGPGRGSAAGSLVAYGLQITDIDPLAYDLLFERFLNPERVSMPDIDVDFCEERRGEVIDYVRQKYGRECVGQIITFGTLKSRAAIKDVGRVLGFTAAETDSLAKLIPNQPNYSLTVADAVKAIPDVRRLYEQDERVRQLFDYAIALEGLARHAGIHAAGIVIAPGPLEEYVPVCTLDSKGAGSVSAGSANGNGSSSEESDGRVVVTQYDMNALEQAGMLKMDFLGLTTLTVLHDAVAMIRERRGIPFDMRTLPFDDEATYRSLRAGHTAGVFQFESPLATDMLRAMRADRFDDLVASNALMRPGPLDAGMHRVYCRRKKGEEPVTYLLTELEDILKPTYGVITFQEQVMRIVQRLAGISLAEADVVRKAMGKKDQELIERELAKFREKAIARGFPKEIVEHISNQIDTFGRYGFNKSHSVAYSVLSYQTAYLKVHYPAEFMAALLSSCIGDTDKVVKYIAEAREIGLEVLPPDINESGYKFTVVGDNRLRFGLGALRNVGRSAIDSLLAAREHGPVRTLHELCARVDLRVCNRRVFESLIHSGALDSLEGNRAQLAAALDGVLQDAQAAQAEHQSGQGSLFGGGPAGNPTPQLQRPLPNVPPAPESERLAREKEVLGFYTSGHPLEPFRAEAELLASHQVAAIGKWTGDTIALACVITAVRKQVSRKTGSDYARLVLEDFSGSAEVLVFPEAWAAMAHSIRTDVPVLVRGSYPKRDEGSDNPTFVVESVQPLAEFRANGQIAIAINLADRTLPAAVMADVASVVTTHPGAAPIEIQWNNGDGAVSRWRSRTLRVAPSGPVLNELRALLGESSVRLVRGA
jgi:DNA polymerase-3 subunit alpha